jgi:alanine racemase
MIHTRPVWAEISRSALLHNYRLLAQLAGPAADLLTVVKADAYGHGLAGCAQTLAAAGAHRFGVTSVEEGVALRAVCPAAQIVILSGAWHGEADALLDHHLTPVVWDPAHLDMLEPAAQRRGCSAAQIPVHLEIDTGMSRQGAPLGQLPLLLGRLLPESPLRLEALMTHFHSPDNEEATRAQEQALAEALRAATQAGLHPEYLSAGSSAAFFGEVANRIALLAQQTGARRMLRPGIALYGYVPYAVSHALQPVLTWKTRVVSLRTIAPGTTVGYDGTFTAQRTSRLALLPVGYADGLSRGLSNRGSVLVRGQRAPVAGRISMDHTSVDVTEIAGVERGDEVVLIGHQDGASITAADLADLTGTIPYEVLCDVAARVPRISVE